VLTRPDDVTDVALRQALAAGWGIDAESLDYRPVGFGSHHWSVAADGRRWFATIDDLETKRISLEE